MKKNILKKILFSFSVVLISFSAKAQLGFNYSQFDFGVGLGLNQVYGDAETITAKPSVSFSLNYNQTPFVNYILEAHAGQMAGGNALATQSGRQFTSTFSAFQFRAQVQAGEIMDYSQSQFLNALKNFYVGAGIGIVYDNITNINRYSYKIDGFYTGGQDNANEIFLPVRIGYEFKIYNSYNEPNFKVDIGYQYNAVFGDELDGFKAGSKNDTYSQFNIGVKFALGGVTSYRKQIHY